MTTGHGAPAGPPLYGARPEAVLAAIRARAARRRAGDAAPDGRKIALVIEGGAMRAVCSAGGAAALAHLGYVDLFDEVYATSAGAMNASYFLSHQPSSGMRVYLENCTTRMFFNPLRFWKVIDVDHLFEQVVLVEKPLDVARILASPTALFVAIADQRTGEGRVVDVRATTTPLLQILKAATAIPVLYNRTVDVDGRPSLDGGIAIPFPLEQALANGCTDVLVLLTRSADHRDQPPTWASRRMFDLLCARGSVGLNEAYATRHTRVHRARELALGHAPVPASSNVATICTEAAETVRRTTAEGAVLRAAAIRYGRSVLRAFGADDHGWDLSQLADG